MDQSYSEADVSLSPSQILERLQMLRHWQLLQQGKLQKQQLQYSETSEITSSITELVSHFSNSTSYNTFRTLLQSSQENVGEVSPRLNINNVSRKSSLQNVIEGVSVLNLSGESEYINSPISSRSTASTKQDSSNQRSAPISEGTTLSKKQISLDDMPILSPKKDFETLIKEKLKQETNVSVNPPKQIQNVKKTFLKRGQGTARFGLKKNDFKIQNTKSLPWRKKSSTAESQMLNIKNKSIETKEITQSFKDQVQKVVDKPKVTSPLESSSLPSLKEPDIKLTTANTADCNKQLTTTNKQLDKKTDTNSNFMLEKQSAPIITIPKGKHPFAVAKEKTWAAVFTKEQDDFLRKLKQSTYYKNFASPSKSTVSDASCDELLSIRQQREETEQNMFNLIENKVSNESFAMDNSFFNRFIKRGDLECSGESTPLVFQKCLSKNPNLMHILPDVMGRKGNDETCSNAGTCDSDYTECSEQCSSESSCCSCQTVTESNLNTPCNKQDTNKETSFKKKVPISKKSMDAKKDDEQCQNESVTATNEAMNANIAEMNSKLIATSELLKDRLRELEDEIDTFRKENANLSKMREEIDLERQKFYEEKTTFEQKFNEEKILSEYYLAEEKEKLAKQKQMYERYVREMRGRLSKKEKDEIANLKKEIHELRDEIKIKDAKSTSTIARLRNQIKIMEKDKKSLEIELEKLKKENKRIQHSNEITRRLTNLKYLEQINKKLSNMATKHTDSDVKVDSDVKYRSYEIERQSRSRKSEPLSKGGLKKRAKSVPNLKVTSRYAKYFSQKDSPSDKDRNKTTIDDCQIFQHSFEDDVTSDNEMKLDLSNLQESNSESEEENNLEKIYNERFKSPSPSSKRTSTSTSENSPEFINSKMDRKDFFIQKSSKKLKENSLNKQLPSHKQTSPFNTNSNESNSSNPCQRMSNEYHLHNTNVVRHQDFVQNSHRSSNQRTKSPVSILSNRSSSSHKSGTVINKELIADTRMIPSPEPTSSKTSLSKTNLQPIEIRRPDGTRELKFPNGNAKLISADGKYSKFTYYNGDIKENFYDEGRIKYFYAETKTFHTTQPDGLEILEFADGQVEKRYKDGSTEIRLPNGSVRYFDPKNEHVREEWRFPDGAALTVSANGEQRIVFPNGQVEVHAKDHKRREFPDGTMKLVYNDGTTETRYASGRIRIKDKHGNLIMDSSAS